MGDLAGNFGFFKIRLVSNEVSVAAYIPKYSFGLVLFQHNTTSGPVPPVLY